MSTDSEKKNVHIQKRDNSTLILAVSAFFVLSFLFIFIAVSIGVSQSSNETEGVPANWSSASETTVNTDSVSKCASFALKDSMNSSGQLQDTLTIEQIIQQINLLRRRIVETHIVVNQFSEIKKDVDLKKTKLILLQDELNKLKAEYDELVNERNVLPEKIISTVDSKLSTGR